VALLPQPFAATVAGCCFGMTFSQGFATVPPVSAAELSFALLLT
jgi:hypothetical protein